MQFRIEFDGAVDSEISKDLIEIEQVVKKDYGSSFQEIHKYYLARQGIKADSNLVIGLTIAGVTTGFVQTIITILQYWQSQKPKYKIFIKCRHETYTLSNANREEVEEIINVIRNLPDDVAREINILISKK